MAPDQSVRPWGETTEAHFRVDTVDGANVVRGFERRLRVSPALPTGLHIDVAIWGVNGNQDQHHAGINLTPHEAVLLVAHIAKVLARGDWSASDEPGVDAA